MASENPTDVLPMLTDANPGFPVAMRGYDRNQVDQFLGRMDEDLRATISERDAAAARSADLAAQLASAQAQIESLRRQLRTANEAVTADNIDERVRARLEAANADAAKTRAAAEADATAIRTGANDAAARVRAAATAEADEILAQATQRHLEADDTFRRRLADADQHRAMVEEQLATSMAQARADEDRLTIESEAVRVRLDAEAQAERERLDAESLARRIQAEEDFEVTLRLRRTAEAALSAEQKAAAEAEAAQTISAAQAQAVKMVDKAASEVRSLQRDRDDVYAQLERLHARLSTVLSQTKAATPAGPPDAPAQ
jgi:DivIVA domain-containing protein